MRHLFLCCTASAILGGLIVAGFTHNGPVPAFTAPASAQDLRLRPETALIANPSTPLRPGLTQEELTNIQVYERANRGVVNVTTRTRTVDRFWMIPIPGEGAGSGSVIDKKGHVLTNFHVVEDAREIQVTLSSGKSYPAEVVGTDPDQDIAVLKIDASADELFPVTIGTSDGLRVGQRVYTLGNPFGFDGTLTTGIISNLNRTLPSRTGPREMKSIIQTDAAMNPGNSGGPLLDTSGQMIGMNVAIATKTGQNSGLGFAIPVNRIRQIVPQLIQHGKVIRADVGIIAVNELDAGLQIVQVNRGGPADRAGLRGWRTVRREVRRGPLSYVVEQEDRSSADIIVAVDGVPVESARAFVETIEQHRPGDRIVLNVLRGGEHVDISVELGSS